MFGFLTPGNRDDNSLEGIYMKSNPKPGLRHAFPKARGARTG